MAAAIYLDGGVEAVRAIILACIEQDIEFLTLFAFLKSGGNWVNLGGVPFSLPVIRESAAWKIETRQTAYHKRLGITQAFPVNSCTSFHASEGLGDEIVKGLGVEEAQELYVRFTSTKDFPGEDGSGGQRDARLRPLVIGSDASGKRVAAPIVNKMFECGMVP